MSQLDFFTLVLPFVLSYTIFFLALKQIELFKEGDDDKFPALVAVIASFFVAQFIATNPYYSQFFVQYFGKITIGLIGILGLFVLLGFVGWKQKTAKGPGLALVIISIVGAAFVSAGGFGEPWNVSLPIGDVNLQSLLLDSGLIWLLIIGGVLYWVSSEDNDKGGGANMADALNWLAGNNEEGE
jgi:hypothetical protein